MAEILEIFTATGQQPLKFTAYDGSFAGTTTPNWAWTCGRPAAPPTWPPLPANSGLPARTYRVTCRRTACTPAIRTSC